MISPFLSTKIKSGLLASITLSNWIFISQINLTLSSSTDPSGQYLYNFSFLLRLCFSPNLAQIIFIIIIVIFIINIIIITITIVIIITITIVVTIIITDWLHLGFQQRICFIFIAWCQKVPHSSRTFRTMLVAFIKTVFCNSVILIPMVFNLSSAALTGVARPATINGTTITFVLHTLFSSLVRSNYFYIFSTS